MDVACGRSANARRECISRPNLCLRRFHRFCALSGHVDMVTEKNSASTHDFLKDPIRLLVEGDWLTADGTTLGADNGIGVAAALTLLDCKLRPCMLPSPGTMAMVKYWTETRLGEVGAVGYMAVLIVDNQVVRQREGASSNPRPPRVYLLECSRSLAAALLRFSRPYSSKDNVSRCRWSRELSRSRGPTVPQRHVTLAACSVCECPPTFIPSQLTSNYQCGSPCTLPSPPLRLWSKCRHPRV